MLNLLWTLKSFYHFSQRSYPAVIHDDGTLTAADLEILRRHFPDSRVISAAEAESTVAAALKSYPRCARYRGLHSLARKVFDIGTYFRADRLLLLDSDLIFFRTPDELLSRLDADQLPRSVFNAGQNLMLNVSADEARQRFGIELVERINSGLAVLRPAGLQLRLDGRFSRQRIDLGRSRVADRANAVGLGRVARRRGAAAGTRIPR